MTLSETISADYTLRPSELAEVLATLVKARQPTLVWGPPGAAKSMIARQVASDHGYNYVDIRALLLDPVDLRGIPWRDEDGRTRWAPPVFLPPSDDPGLWLINLEELPSAVPMVQAALYQLFLERKCGEYELPEGASLIACGNRDADRAVVHRMPTPLSNRLVHLEIRVDARDWCSWGAANGIAPEVLFFIELEPELLHQFDSQSKEHAFPSPRSWEFASNIVKHRNGLDPATERALFRGTVGEAAAVQFTSFLKIWRELPHPRAVINDPGNADIPENASTLMALCGSLYRMASDVTGAATELVEIVRRDKLEPLDADAALEIGERDPGPDGKPRLAVNARSKRAAIVLPASSRMIDDGGVQERVRLIRPATGETMARAELDASNWRRADEARWRPVWDAEIAGLPSHRESRFWLATGLLLPVWDRLPEENMRVRRLTTDPGSGEPAPASEPGGQATSEALIGRVLDAEQVLSPCLAR